MTLPLRLDDALASVPAITARGTDQARAAVSRVLDDHALTAAHADDVRLELRSAHAGPVGLDRLEYRSEVSISSAGLGYFHLVQLPLRGRAVLRAREEEVAAAPGIATLPPLEDGFRQRWEEGSAHLLVYVEAAEVRRVQAAMGEEPPTGPALPARIDLRTAEGHAFVRAVQDLDELLGAAAHRDVAYALRLVSELLVVRLLHAVRPAAGVATPARGDRVYRRFVETAEAQVPHGAGVVDIARMMGVPLRTLQDHVRSAVDRTPTAVLRELRLRRAHALLTEADPRHDTVTAIAEACGFGHLGRFAADYRHAYGCTPASTLHGEPSHPCPPAVLGPAPRVG